MEWRMVPELGLAMADLGHPTLWKTTNAKGNVNERRSLGSQGNTQLVNHQCPIGIATHFLFQKKRLGWGPKTGIFDSNRRIKRGVLCHKTANTVGV